MLTKTSSTPACRVFVPFLLAFVFMFLFGGPHFERARRLHILYTKEDFEKIIDSNESVPDEALSEPASLFQNETPRLILDWTAFFGDPIGQNWLSQCPSYNCKMTSNKSLLQSSDAVVFHVRNIDLKNLPKSRNWKQLFVFFLLESPRHTFANLHALDDFFNVTISYRFDSDFYLPYGGVEKFSDPALQSLTRAAFLEKFAGEKNLRNKTKLGAWIVSHCPTSSRRETLIRELQKYVQVDAFGKCGTKSCGNNDQCFELLRRDYKFYFSFENSICRDYVTEKLYGRLDSFVVPVVLKRDISHSHVGLPERSVIFADDFCSAADLADYLSFLDRNFTAYLQYFHWRQYFRQVGSFRCPKEELKRCGFCGLCRDLHRQTRAPNSLRDPHDWWDARSYCEEGGPLVDSLLNGRHRNVNPKCYGGGHWPNTDAG